MRHYERSYATARTVFTVLEFVGRALIVIGGILALMGLLSGGIVGLLGDPQILGRIIAALPGIGMSFGGLITVAYAQSSRATVDTAEIAREQLILTRSLAGQNQDLNKVHNFESSKIRAKNAEIEKFDHEGEAANSQSEYPNTANTDTDEFYRETEIVKEKFGYKVGERLFGTVELAKAHIDRNLKTDI